jgi:hypothetical protein
MMRSMPHLFHSLIAIVLAAAGILTAEVVRMEHGHLEVSVDHAPDGNGFVYTVAGSKYSDPAIAAKGLEYIYAHWPEKKLPTLEYSCNTKLSDPGIGQIQAIVERIALRKDVVVIFRPPARGAIPDSWFTAAKLLKQSAEQGGADQPATAPQLKSEGKDNPQPESKVRPQ